MKILVLNWKCPKHPEAGGAEKFLFEICRRIVKKGYEVVWFSPKFRGCKEEEIIEGVKIVRRGGRFSVYIFALLYYIFRFRSKFDVIVDDINGVPFFTPIYANNIIAVVHHIVGWEVFRKELPLPLAVIAYFFERLIPVVYGKATIIAVSESTKNDLIKMGIPRENIYIIYNGVDIDSKYLNNEKSDEFLIIYFGRVKRYKRVDHILRAFKLITKKVPQAKLIIAGRGDDYSRLKKISKELGIKVEFLGEISETTKVKLLQKACLYLITSEKEGWGLTVIEANACGTPVIAYNVLGLKDSIKNNYNGLIVEESDIKNLADKSIEVLLNNKLRRKLSKNAIKWSRRFSWEESARKFEGVINSLGAK